jgi:DNA-directed RNA polymerase subunit M/transcription elongation factor TFIIS
MEKTEFIRCPVCGNKTRDKIREDTVLKNFPLFCPKCKSENVSVDLVQVEGKTKKHGNGLGGHINNTARGLTAICTLGMSNLVWKKSKGNEKTKFKNKTVCVCQNCGHTWNA